MFVAPKKNRRKDKKHVDSADKQRDAELELLITDLKPKSDRAQETDERPHKRHKGNHAAKDKAEDFTLDPRFARMTSDPRFAIDPTNPHSKKTSAVGAINQVKAQQRQQGASAPAEQSERPLSSLVASIKNKTQQHFKQEQHRKPHDKKGGPKKHKKQ